MQVKVTVRCATPSTGSSAGARGGQCGPWLTARNFREANTRMRRRYIECHEAEPTAVIS